MPKSTEKINFTVYGIPKPKGSMRAFAVGKRAIITNNNPNTKDWQNLVAVMAQKNKPKNGLLEDAVRVQLDFYFCRPKSVSEKKRPFHIVKPDLDKLQRAILDGLKGIVYKDDCQIINISASKNYCDSPRVEIEVRRFGE